MMYYGNFSCIVDLAEVIKLSAHGFSLSSTNFIYGLREIESKINTLR